MYSLKTTGAKHHDKYSLSHLLDLGTRLPGDSSTCQRCRLGRLARRLCRRRIRLEPRGAALKGGKAGQYRQAAGRERCQRLVKLRMCFVWRCAYTIHV